LAACIRAPYTVIRVASRSIVTGLAPIAPELTIERPTRSAMGTVS
jgi:hypothetical protein